MNGIEYLKLKLKKNREEKETERRVTMCIKR